MASQEQLVEAIEAVANFLRGAKFDMRIPADVRQAFAERAQELDALVEDTED